MSPIIQPPLTGIPAFSLEPGTVYFNRSFLSGGRDKTGQPRQQDPAFSRGVKVPGIIRHDTGEVEVHNWDEDYTIYIAPLTQDHSSLQYTAVVSAAQWKLEPESDTSVRLELGRSYRIAISPPSYVVVVSMPLEVAAIDHRETTTRKKIDSDAQATLEAIERVRAYLEENPDYRRTLAYELQEFLLGNPVPVRVAHDKVKRAFYGPNVADVHKAVWKKITNEGRGAGSPAELITFLLSNHLLTIEDYTEAIAHIKRLR
ncbi:hypothetical protein [Nocardia gamkensis]|uniref:hypothetical protein n=1 Tax=Nocardia gamkensis TaxID=352869 RepID=UPI0037C63A18